VIDAAADHVARSKRGDRPLLHKHPDRVHEEELSFGTAPVCYPEATTDRFT